MNRFQARENAFLLLFEHAARGGDNAEELFDTAVNERGLEADEYVTGVYRGVTEHLAEIDAVIDPALVGWNRNRISFASTALLRLAAYEMMFRKDIPAKVSINEAIELSKKYDDEKTYLFVNGVLNRIAETLGRKK